MEARCASFVKRSDLPIAEIYHLCVKYNKTLQRGRENLPKGEYIIVGYSFIGGLEMNLPGLLRMYKDYIHQVGMVRFEQPDQTVYAAPTCRLLIRQKKAMELLRHLDVAPPPAQLDTMRGLKVMAVSHHTLSDFMSVWKQQDREGRIELIRRLGATVGMVHSLRHMGTGDIVNPNSTPVAQHLVGLIRKNFICLSLQRRADTFPEKISGLIEDVVNLWGNTGGTLSGNWAGFPPVKIWDNGLMIMDLSQANYSVPFMDFVNIRPQVIGMEDVSFFWEYFLQGYCATSELPSSWKQKIELLYKVNLLQALATGIGEKRAGEDCQTKWWAKL